MDPEIVEDIRALGKLIEDCGRTLQTKRQRWFVREEVRDLRKALRHASNALSIYEKKIPLK